MLKRMQLCEAQSASQRGRISSRLSKYIVEELLSLYEKSDYSIIIRAHGGVIIFWVNIRGKGKLTLVGQC